MNTLHANPEIRSDLTVEERIELVLYLTCRLELLDDLLRNARARRWVADSGAGQTKANQAELDSSLVR
jgi:hypothetical protein